MTITEFYKLYYRRFQGSCWQSKSGPLGLVNWNYPWNHFWTHWRVWCPIISSENTEWLCCVKFKSIMERNSKRDCNGYHFALFTYFIVKMIFQLNFTICIKSDLIWTLICSPSKRWIYLLIKSIHTFRYQIYHTLIMHSLAKHRFCIMTHVLPEISSKWRMIFISWGPSIAACYWSHPNPLLMWENLCKGGGFHEILCTV